MSRIQDDIYRAKRHIERGEYYTARSILQRMPYSTDANTLLNRLDAIELENFQPQSFTVPHPQYPHNQNLNTNTVTINNIVNNSRGNLGFFDILSMLIIVVCMAIWSIAITSGAAATGNPATVGATIVMLALYWLVAWVLYFLGWKFYWIMLALGWVCSTVWTIYTLGSLAHAFPLPT